MMVKRLGLGVAGLLLTLAGSAHAAGTLECRRAEARLANEADLTKIKTFDEGGRTVTAYINQFGNTAQMVSYLNICMGLQDLNRVDTWSLTDDGDALAGIWCNDRADSQTFFVVMINADGKIIFISQHDE